MTSKSVGGASLLLLAACLTMAAPQGAWGCTPGEMQYKILGVEGDDCKSAKLKYKVRVCQPNGTWGPWVEGSGWVKKHPSGQPWPKPCEVCTLRVLDYQIWNWKIYRIYHCQQTETGETIWRELVDQAKAVQKTEMRPAGPCEVGQSIIYREQTVDPETGEPVMLHVFYYCADGEWVENGSWIEALAIGVPSLLVAPMVALVCLLLGFGAYRLRAMRRARGG